MSPKKNDLPTELALLDREIVRSTALLKKIPIRPAHAVLDEAVARYVFAAAATARALHAAAAIPAPDGVKPLARFLFECVTDLVYIIGSPDPDEEAARTVVWDSKEWVRHRELHRAAAEEDPTIQREWPDLSLEEMLENFINSTEREGGDTTHLRAVWKREKGNRRHQPHWSGVTRTDVLKRVKDRAPAATWTVLRPMWAVLSDEGHASPNWRRWNVLIHDARVSAVHDAAGRTVPEHSAQWARIGRNLLKLVNDWVDQFLEMG